MGLSPGQRGTPGATPPKAGEVASPGHPGRRGRARGSARTAAEGQPRAEPVLLPAARLGACCFLLGIAQLRSSPTPGAPARAARGGRGLARASGSPAPAARWLLGRLSASVPPAVPPATPRARARDPPLRAAGRAAGAGCFEVEVGCALFLFVCFEFFSSLSRSLFVFAFLEFFWFWFFLVTVETLDFFIKHPSPGSDGTDEGRTRATRTRARQDKGGKKKKKKKRRSREGGGFSLLASSRPVSMADPRGESSLTVGVAAVRSRP